MIEKSGAGVKSAIDSAPSYDGQFRSRISGIGLQASSQARHFAGQLEGASQNLQNRALAFEAADGASLYAWNGISTWLAKIRDAGLGLLDRLAWLEDQQIGLIQKWLKYGLLLNQAAYSNFLALFNLSVFSNLIDLNILRPPFWSRADLKNFLKSKHLIKYYDDLKVLVPKHSTKFGKIAKIIGKNIPVIEIGLGTGIDYSEYKGEKNAFEVALAKNVIETFISPVTLINAGVQIVGTVVVIGYETIGALTSPDEETAANVSKIAAEMQANLDSIDLEIITKDLSKVIVNPKIQVYKSFWESPNLQTGMELFIDSSFPPYAYIVKSDIQDITTLGQDVFQLIPNVAKTIESIETAASSLAALESNFILSNIPLPDAYKETLEAATASYIESLANQPPLFNQTYNNLQEGVQDLMAGKAVSGISKLGEATDLFYFSYPWEFQSSYSKAVQSAFIDAN